MFCTGALLLSPHALNNVSLHYELPLRALRNAAATTALRRVLPALAQAQSTAARHSAVSRPQPTPTRRRPPPRCRSPPHAGIEPGPIPVPCAAVAAALSPTRCRPLPEPSLLPAADAGHRITGGGFF
jgi:hypothetical protein